MGLPFEVIMGNENKLSENFSLKEMTDSNTAIRLNINNTPSLQYTSNLIVLCNEVLEPVRKHFSKPVKVSSGFRCAKLNAAINGAKLSQHTLGQAADIEIAGIPNKVLAKYIQDNLDFDQLILEYYVDGIPNSGWVHVSYNEGNNRKEVMKASLVSNKLTYTHIKL